MMLEIQNFYRRAFAGITALTALNRNAKGINGVPCRYKGFNGVLLES